MEKVLVTGNLGYIGTVLTEQLLKEDYRVVGIDTNYYRDKQLFEFKFSKKVHQITKDIRNITKNDIKGIDSIIHLAALSNDPLGKLNPTLTDEINFKASLRLAKLAKSLNISRFLFSSSCSIYGETNNEQLSENDKLNPLTPYAHSKVDLENALSDMADNNFSPCYMRNSTAYGISPNMRFDLVVNNLMGWGYTTKEIKILSDGKAWRPIVHIRDIADAFIAGLKAPREVIHNEAYNVGINTENYQVKDMAHEIKNLMKDCEVKILGKDNPDNRNYIVNFNKIQDNLKSFKPKWNLKKGIKELFDIFEKIKLNFKTFEEKNFTRVKQLKYIIKNKYVNENLFWIKT